MAGQSKAWAMAEPVSERGSIRGRAHVERRDPPGRPATRATAPYPIPRRRDTSVTLFPASHPCFFSPPLMNLKLVCFCDAELDEASLDLCQVSMAIRRLPVPPASSRRVPAAMWASHPALRKRETVAGWDDGTTSCVTPKSFDCDCDCGTASQTFLASSHGHRATRVWPPRHAATYTWTHRKEIRGQTKTHMGQV